MSDAVSHRGAPDIRAPAAILDGLTTGVIVMTVNRVIVYMNPAAESLLSVSSQRANGEGLVYLLRDAAPFDELVGEALRIRGPVASREVKVCNRFGAPHEQRIDCRVTPLEGEHGADDQILLELRDADARLRLDRERTLLHQQGISRGIARQLAHEIKNPLGGIRGAAQLLMHEFGEDRLTEYTDVIIGEADRLSKLVDTMLGPGSPGEPVTINIHKLLRRVRRLVGAEAPATLHIEEDYDPSLPQLNVDADQIVQALLNLVRNASQAVAGDGRIVLRTRAVSGLLLGAKRHALVARVDIEDDGPGVPDELVNSIFLPLVSGRSDGTGLGLAIAQELVIRHGGLIELDSQPSRTIFSVYLPINGEVPS